MTATGIEVRGAVSGEHAAILTPDALQFLAGLHRAFDARRQELLAARAGRQREIDAGALPDFLPTTAALRERDWTVAPVPPDLRSKSVV